MNGAEGDLGAALAPSAFIDSDNLEIRGFAHRLAGDLAEPRAIAQRLYYGVRDEILYDPYRDFVSPDTYRASACLRAGRGFCIAKAALFAAAARAVGIPARIGLADVRNHLASPRLRALMGSDVFIFHGYGALFLGGRWVKATPTFNVSLCEKFGVEPLIFDGRSDALFHPFDRAGRRHMEYLADHGTFDEVPVTRVIEAFRQRYPRLFAAGDGGDFAAEAQRGGV